MADDIDHALRNATKSYQFPENLWLNLKVIIIERLSRKVQIDRPGLRREKVRDWVEIDENPAMLDHVKNSRHYEELLQNLSDNCKDRIEGFEGIH